MGEGGGGELGFPSELGAMGVPGLVGLVSPLGGTAGTDSPAGGGGGISTVGGSGAEVFVPVGGGDIGDEETSGDTGGEIVGGVKVSSLLDCLVRLANTMTTNDSFFKQLSLIPLMKKNDPD